MAGRQGETVFYCIVQYEYEDVLDTRDGSAGEVVWDLVGVWSR